MKKSTKIITICATASIVCGIVICGITAPKVIKGFDNAIHEPKERSQKTFDEEIKKISIDTDVLDINAHSYTGDKVAILYPPSNSPYEESVTDGTLNLTIKSEKNKWSFIPTIHKDSEIEICIPQNKKVDLDIKADYGDITLTNLNGNVSMLSDAGDVDILTVTGNIDGSFKHGSIDIANVNGDSLNITSNVGDVDVDSANVKNLNITSDYGDIDFTDVKADNVTLKTDVAYILGDLIGDASEYNIWTNVNVGSCNLNNRKNPNSKKSLEVTSRTGDVEIHFNEAGHSASDEV